MRKGTRWMALSLVAAMTLTGCGGTGDGDAATAENSTAENSGAETA